MHQARCHNGQSLTDDRTTLAEHFRGTGYETHAVVAWLPLSHRFGFGQGFDHYSEDSTLGEMATWVDHDVPEEKFFALADHVTDRALKQVDSATSDLQFFFLHYFDPHAPYGISAGERFSEARLFRELASGQSTTQQLLDRARRLYALDLAYLDDSLDRLFARLDEDSGEFETHVFLTSDHGERFGEAGGIGHGNQLTAAEIHVPAVIISPKVPPIRRDDVAGGIDVAPTLLTLAGLKSLSEGMRGRDISGTSTPPTRIWGMRRSTTRARLDERNLDGRTHILPKHWFYVIDSEGRIHRGNADHIVHSPEDDGSCTEQDLAARFGALQARVGPQRTREPVFALRRRPRSMRLRRGESPIHKRLASEAGTRPRPSRRQGDAGVNFIEVFRQHRSRLAKL